jgi:hypothetical protein
MATNTTNDKAVLMTLSASGAGPGVQIISQPANGSVGLDTNTQVATYYAAPGFVGTEQFTFAVFDGSKNSNLGTGTVTVTQGEFSFGVTPQVPPSHPAGWPVAYSVLPAITNNTNAPLFDWDFGDGTAHNSNPYATHTYTASGPYNWRLVTTVAGQVVATNGTIAIDAPVVLNTIQSSNSITLVWPNTTVDTMVEQTRDPGGTGSWTWVSAPIDATTNWLSLSQPISGTQFFRVRRPW